MSWYHICEISLLGPGHLFLLARAKVLYLRNVELVYTVGVKIQ